MRTLTEEEILEIIQEWEDICDDCGYAEFKKIGFLYERG